MILDQRFIWLATLVLLASCARPVANFVVQGADQKAPATIKFENESKNAESYLWDFGDGQRSTEADPQHEYLGSGRYTVTLEARKGDKINKKVSSLVIGAPKLCMVQIETEYGNMRAILYDATPQHRDNFLKLAEDGYFNDLLFHRVIDGFMIQGGDPDSRNAKADQRLGMGGPGYRVPAEFVDTLIHTKGALAAARTGGPSNPKKESSGSQFYIVQGRTYNEKDIRLMEARTNNDYSPDQKKAYAELGGTPQLDREYTVFGRVVEGLEVIDKIAAVATDAADRPKKDVKMTIRVIQ